MSFETYFLYRCLLWAFMGLSKLVLDLGGLLRKFLGSFIMTLVVYEGASGVSKVSC